MLDVAALEALRVSRPVMWLVLSEFAEELLPKCRSRSLDLPLSDFLFRVVSRALALCIVRVRRHGIAAMGRSNARGAS